MADIIDPLVIGWDNNRARPLCDTLTRTLAALLAYQADYAAYSIAAAVTADGATNKIGDGYAVDGRQPITGTQLQNLIAGINQVVTAWNTTLVTGVGTTAAAIVQGIQVNGSPHS